MDTEMRDTQPRADALSRRAEPYLALSERLAIAALIAAFNFWMGLAEVIPDNRSRS